MRQIALVRTSLLCTQLNVNFNSFTSIAVVTGCTHGDVRLSLGVTSSDGVVEVCVNGAWGGLCQDRLSLNDANVVCRQLQLPEGQLNELFEHQYTP